MQKLSDERIPIVVKVDQVREGSIIGRISLLFQRVVEGYQRQKDLVEEDLHKPAFVVHGYMERQPGEEALTEEVVSERFSRLGICDIILMNSADHKQCTYIPSEEQLFVIAGDSRLVSYKNRAIEEGCSFVNRSLFLINHVYAGTIGRYF